MFEAQSCRIGPRYTERSQITSVIAKLFGQFNCVHENGLANFRENFSELFP